MDGLQSQQQKIKSGQVRGQTLVPNKRYFNLMEGKQEQRGAAREYWKFWGEHKVSQSFLVMFC